MNSQNSLEERLAYVEEDLRQAQHTILKYQLEMLRLTQRIERVEKRQKAEKANAEFSQHDGEVGSQEARFRMGGDEVESDGDS